MFFYILFAQKGELFLNFSALCPFVRRTLMQRIQSHFEKTLSQINFKPLAALGHLMVWVSAIGIMLVFLSPIDMYPTAKFFILTSFGVLTCCYVRGKGAKRLPLLITTGFALVTFLLWQSPHLLPHTVMFSVLTLLSSVIVLEFWGHLLHRYLQHLGKYNLNLSILNFSRRNHFAHHRRNNAFGRNYLNKNKHKNNAGSYEDSLSLTWLVPSLTLIYGPHLLCYLFLFNIESLALYLILFYVGTFSYAILIVDRGHLALHKEKNWWDHYHITRYWFSGYFDYCKRQHVVHHFDERFSFGITSYITDYLFKSLLHQDLVDELCASCIKKGISVKELINISDFINNALIFNSEASPEDIAYIFAEDKYPLVVKKQLVVFYNELLKIRDKYTQVEWVENTLRKVEYFLPDNPYLS